MTSRRFTSLLACLMVALPARTTIAQRMAGSRFVPPSNHPRAALQSSPPTAITMSRLPAPTCRSHRGPPPGIVTATLGGFGFIVGLFHGGPGASRSASQRDAVIGLVLGAAVGFAIEE